MIAANCHTGYHQSICVQAPEKDSDAYTQWEYEVPVAALIASSVKVWAQIVEEEREWSLVLEDDVVVSRLRVYSECATGESRLRVYSECATGV
jgi:hypothetical protein